MPSIAALAAAVVAFFALALLVPAVGALIHSDWLALEAFLLLAVAYGFLASVTIMALTPKLRRLSRAGVFSATITMWLALVVVAIPPFLLIENMALGEAVFEAVSASITLGVSFRAEADISDSMVLYRGMVAWQGGLLTLLLAVYVLGRYEVGGTPNRHLRYVLHSLQNGNPRIVQTFFEVFVPYLAMTLTCAAALVIARTNPADALNISINIASTNGFLPIHTGASVLNNAMGEIILIIFMLLGATSIVWHRTVIFRRWRHVRDQAEMTAFGLWVVVVAGIAAISALLIPVEHFSAGGAVLNVIFDTVSIVTTTGITHDPRYGVILPFELILTFAIMGGCSYSTAGGIKVFRLSAMLHHSANEIRRLVYPHAVLAHSVEEDPQELRLAKAVWSAFFVALLTLMVATLIFSAQDIGLADALGMAVGSFSSTANLVALAVDLPPGEAPTDLLMLTIAAVGLLARIELLVILAAFNQSRW